MTSHDIDHVFQHHGAVARKRARTGEEPPVSWLLMERAVERIAIVISGGPTALSAGEVIESARHLAQHYEQAGKRVPDLLQAVR